MATCYCDNSLTDKRYLRCMCVNKKSRGKNRRQERSTASKNELKSINANLCCLSEDMTSTADKKPEVVFPNVRNLVNQFNNLVSSDSNYTLNQGFFQPQNVPAIFSGHQMTFHSPSSSSEFELENLSKDNFSLPWRTASDNDVNQSVLTKDELARLNSSAGDLSADKSSLCQTWSLTSSLCDSADNLNLISRSVSCDHLGEPLCYWDRSSSSDSAVVVEDDPMFPTPPMTTSPSLNQEVLEPPKNVCELRTSECCQKATRPPSVVISDHSGNSVSVHVALASEGFSLNLVDDYLLNDGYVCPRKVSECSTCSSVSTVDMNSDIIRSRRSSDCSSAYLTASDDEVEVCLQQPTPPPIRKSSPSSNWRKVRNVVQWTPFIQTYKRHKYPWVQLAGHQGNFRAGYKQGTILKKLCPAEEKAFETLMKDTLKPFVPEYLGIVEGSDTDKYLQLQDLLSDFSAACVMDIKMGVRTYLEEELAKARIKPKLRKDMYDKMVQIDIKAPNEAEHRAKAVTKPRYMVWRETISSTATLGFRIEGVRRGDGTSSKDFKTTRTRDQVTKVILGFLKGYPTVMAKYIDRLKEIRGMLEKSKFFKSHELIGSSLLFVHNESRCGVWLIDFAKTIPLPPGVSINHSVPWIEGTHEDGYLIGIDNLIDLMRRIQADQQLYSTTNDLTKTASAPLNNVKRK